MQVSVEVVSSVERRLTIVVPSEQVEQAYAKQIDDVAKKANIKGFRPGKAPKSFIQKQYGASAYQEAVSEVLQKTLYQAIAEQKLKPVTMPRIEIKVSELNKPLEYVAIVETFPEIGSVTFNMDNIEKIKTDVTDADVEFVVQQLLKQHTQWIKVERAAMEKDRVVIDYYGIFEGKEDKAHQVEGYALELGSNTMLPGFEADLIGTIADQEKTLNLVFPENYHNKEQAGKPIQFVVSIKQVFEGEIPNLDEAFVKRLGIKSGDAEELRTQIKQSLEQERDRLVKEKLKEQVFEQILAQNQLDVPASLISQEAKAIHDEVYAKQHHDHASHSEDELNTFNDIAKKRVTLGLLIAEYAKQHHLVADKTRVEARIQEIASVYEDPAEVITWLSSPERRSNIESQVMEDQVLEALTKDVSAIEKVLSYAELRGYNQGSTTTE